MTANKMIRIAFPIMPGSVFDKYGQPCHAIVRGGRSAIAQSH